MAESCDPNWDFSSPVLSDLILYSSYLIFFAPYLLKLISFLSPLFLTTCLLSLAFLTNDNFYPSLVQKLRLNNEDCFDDLGMYDTLFGYPLMEVEDAVEEKPHELLEEKVQPNSKKTEMGGGEKKRMENFLKILDEFEKMASNAEEKKPRAPKQKAESPTIKPHSHRITPRVDESSFKAERLMEANRYGSMRREKEWKRTLACKLFEERHSVDGGEGMDSLWEAYEIDSTKKKVDLEFIDEEDEIEPPLCCLQALKLSTGKMNLGVGIPSLLKISKAIKGIGRLHKHSKKVHNNNGDRY